MQRLGHDRRRRRRFVRRLQRFELVVAFRDVGEDGEAIRTSAGGHILGVEQLRDAEVFLGQAECQGAITAKRRRKRMNSFASQYLFVRQERGNGCSERDVSIKHVVMTLTKKLFSLLLSLSLCAGLLTHPVSSPVINRVHSFTALCVTILILMNECMPAYGGL